MAIDVERREQIAIITMNRPDVLNAFNTEQLQLLLSAVGDLAADPNATRAIVLTGAGERAFAAGADIAEMRVKTPREAAQFARLGHAVCRAIETAPQPVIAAINGFALGGGSEIALACDIRLASENAQLGQPEVSLGIPPGWGATQRMTRLLGPGLAKDLMLTGRRIRADEALRIGLVSAIYPADQLLDRAVELAQQIAANSPVAVRASKDLINRALDVDIDSGLAYEVAAFALAFDSPDQKEGMGAFLEKRKPVFTGE